MPIPYHALTDTQRTWYDHLSTTLDDLIAQIRNVSLQALTTPAFVELRSQAGRHHARNASTC
jgi:hypothetical protein